MPAWSSSARRTSASGRTSATGTRPRGWSAYGGLTRNPYALNRRPGVELRQRCSGGRPARAVRDRHRDRRLDHLPCRLQRLRGHQADGGQIPGAGYRADLAVAGHRGTDGADGARGRRAARRPRRQRHRLRSARAAGMARGQADRRAARRASGATARPPTPPRSERSSCSPRQGADDRRRHRPRVHGGLWVRRRTAGAAVRAQRAAWQTTCRRGPDGGPTYAGRCRGVQPQHADQELRCFGQDLFEQALEAPSSGSREYLAARRPAWHTAATTASTRCCASTGWMRCCHAGLHACDPIDMVYRRAPLGLVHPAGRDGRLSAADRAERDRARPAGRCDVLGYGGAARPRLIEIAAGVRGRPRRGRGTVACADLPAVRVTAGQLRS